MISLTNLLNIVAAEEHEAQLEAEMERRNEGCLCDADDKWGCTYSDYSGYKDALPCLCLCHHNATRKEGGGR